MLPGGNHTREHHMPRLDASSQLEFPVQSAGPSRNVACVPPSWGRFFPSCTSVVHPSEQHLSLLKCGDMCLDAHWSHSWEPRLHGSTSSTSQGRCRCSNNIHCMHWKMPFPAMSRCSATLPQSWQSLQHSGRFTSAVCLNKELFVALSKSRWHSLRLRTNVWRQAGASRRQEACSILIKSRTGACLNCAQTTFP